ncbi:MAG: sugar dehydratase, partial [Candidatus Magasanikbacteria bacterium CG10_big_fil_rev_8_21_14_0_10_43_9]
MSSLSNKNIFVTGGTGLVGSHLVETLLEIEGANIVCLVREKNSKSYFYKQGFEDRVTIVYGDLNDKERIFNIVTAYEIDYIFHIGAQAIVQTSFINPYETFTSNIMGTVHVLEAARLSPRVKGVVVASSDKAYGKNCHNATEDNALAGDHPYDVSKSCTDLIALSYFKTYGVPVTVSRFGNIYGPGDLNMNRIIPGIMKSVIDSTNLELRSDGTFLRDYVYVKDVVDGYVTLAEKIDIAKGEAFNFSSGHNFSVLDLVSKVGSIVEKDVP